MDEFLIRAKTLRKNATDAERQLWRYLRKRQLGVKFRQQQPLGHYIVDFVCFEKRLIIEIDGGQHQEQIVYDEIRTDWLKQQGYKVLRFWNNQVLYEIEAVLEAINAALTIPPPPNPLPQGEGE
jgi:very-short-patch-repair endonuclease